MTVVLRVGLRTFAPLAELLGERLFRFPDLPIDQDLTVYRLTPATSGTISCQFGRPPWRLPGWRRRAAKRSRAAQVSFLFRVRRALAAYQPVHDEITRRAADSEAATRPNEQVPPAPRAACASRSGRRSAITAVSAKEWSSGTR